MENPAEAARWAASIDLAFERSGQTPAIVAGSAVTGLAFVRSLGERRVPVFALDHRGWEVGMLSRYATPLVLPDPAESPKAWVRFLLEAGERLQCRPALIPTGDAHLRPLVAAADRLSEHYSCALPPREVFEALLDKRSQHALLASVGAPLPASVAPGNESEAERAAVEVGLPCLVKPGLGDSWTRRAGAKLEIAQKPDDVRAAYRAMTEAGVGVLVQELIPGGDDAFLGCLCHLDAAGKIQACFTKQKLRQFPPGYGNGSYQVSIHSPQVEEISLALLRRIGYRGTAAIEYKRDPRDGRLKLIEINCRAVSGTQLAIVSGVDLPWIVYRDCIGEPAEPVTDFTAGQRFVNVSWDLQAYLAAGDRSPRGFWRWAKSVIQADGYALISLRDPGPSLRTWSRLWRRSA